MKEKGSKARKNSRYISTLVLKVLCPSDWIRQKRPLFQSLIANLAQEPPFSTSPFSIAVSRLRA